jgi:hypothetical protein
MKAAKKTSPKDKKNTLSKSLGAKMFKDLKIKLTMQELTEIINEVYDLGIKSQTEDALIAGKAILLNNIIKRQIHNK